jgi:AcrR family transcriptional regulator
MSAARRRAKARSDEPAPRRPRGRPARLSREGIVQAVVAMLERESVEPLTIARIGREIDAVPAALYRHFESLDDLLDGVLAQVLATSEPTLGESESWKEQLASWMHGLRAHLLRYPAVIGLIGRSGRTSAAWLEASSTLAEILERAGLTGRDLAATYLWTLEMTVGLAIQEAALPLPQQFANARASRDELSESARARFAPIVHEMERFDGDSFFSFVVEQVVMVVQQRSDSYSG